VLKHFLLLCSLFLSTDAFAQNAPSFDCSKAATADESDAVRICEAKFGHLFLYENNEWPASSVTIGFCSGPESLSTTGTSTCAKT
jgi:hypothetical protein